MGQSSWDPMLEVEKEVFVKLCPNPITATKWAELAQTQSENLKHGLAVNLDPSSLILDTFFQIEDCARAVR
jgi:DNA polymerase-3 subunit delta'